MAAEVTEPPRLASYVGGAWRPGPGDGVDINPSRPGEVVATVAVAGRELAEEACGAAAEGFVSWSHEPAPARGEVLRRAAAILEGRVDQIAREFSREEGKPLAEAVGELRRAVAIFRYYAGQTLEPDGEIYPSHGRSTFLYARREPLGVVLAITPWNFPAAIPAWKIAPALAFGNAVVWKPAEVVPLTSMRIVEALVEAGLPAGLLNLVLGRSSEIGDILVTHPAVAAVTFTGSNPVGRAIQSAATKCGKKVQLELGGKNPALVLADADPAFAAEQVARGAFLSAGQKCTATSRVIVEEAVLPIFMEELVRLARTWPLGDALDPSTVVGPVVSSERMDAVLGYLELARAEGAEVLAGGGRAKDLAPGYFVHPTVLTGLDQSSRVMTEEIFGPVVGVLSASDFEQALRIANATPFGLSASIFTRDLNRALEFVREIEAGVVKVNQETSGLEFQSPFGGIKASSSGTPEQGKVARDFFTRWKTVYVEPQP